MISIIIPCRNGALTLRRQLEALRGQSSTIPFEVIVVDNQSTDGSSTVALEFARLDRRFKVVGAMARAGINYARNQGLAAAVGDHFLFCDSDDVVEQGWLESYSLAFERGAVLVGGPVRQVYEAYGVEVVRSDFLSSHWIYPWPAGANCGFSRRVLDSIGWFDESFMGGGDETDFFWRAQLAGFELTMVSGSLVRYVQRASLAGAYRQNLAYGRSVMSLYAKFKTFGMPRPSLARAITRFTLGMVRVWTVRGYRKQIECAAMGRSIGVIRASLSGRGSTSKHLHG